MIRGNTRAARPAIAAGQGDDGLVSAPDAPILHPIAGPAAAMQTEWTRLAQTVFVGVILWSLGLRGSRLAKSFRAWHGRARGTTGGAGGA